MGSDDMVHYPKIRRIPIYDYVYRKEPLSLEELEKLFSSIAVVEEKIDGKFMYKDIGDYIVFYEYMGLRHEIHYAKLPCYKIAFDVYDKASGKFLNALEKHEVLKDHSWCYVPVIHIGLISIDSWRDKLLRLMRRPSYYGAPLIEGIVVKNYEKQIFGKAINKEFDEALRGEEHYSRRKKKEHNKIYQGEEWLKLCFPSTSN